MGLQSATFNRLDAVLQSAAAILLVCLGQFLRGNPLAYPLLATLFCSALLTSSPLIARSAFASVFCLSIVLLARSESPDVALGVSERIPGTLFPRPQVGPCGIQLRGPEYYAIYQDQSFVDPGLAWSGMECDVCDFSNHSSSMDVNERIRTISYRLVCGPENIHILKRVVHVKQRPAPRILYHSPDSRSIVVAFSSPVKKGSVALAGAIDASSFSIASTPVSKLVYLGDTFRGQENVYSITYEHADSARKVSLVSGSCFDALPPYGECGDFENSLLAHAPASPFISWNASLVSTPDSRISLSLAFDSPVGRLVSQEIAALGPSDFVVEYAPDLESEDGSGGWFSFSLGRAKTFTALSVQALTLLNDDHSQAVSVYYQLDVQAPMDMEIRRGTLKVSLASPPGADDLVAFGSGQGVVPVSRELDVQLGSCCLDNGETCQFAFDAVSCLSLGGVYVMPRDGQCMCTPLDEELERDIDSLPVDHQGPELVLRGSSTILAYAGERVRDPGVVLYGKSEIATVARTLLRNNQPISLVEDDQHIIISDEEGVFTLMYRVEDSNGHIHHAERSIKVRIGAPRMRLAGFGQAYKSVTVEFTSPPTQNAKSLTELSEASFFVIAKRPDGSMSKAVPKLAWVAPLTETSSSSWFSSKPQLHPRRSSWSLRSDHDFTHATRYILALDWSAGSNWAAGDELILTLAKDAECMDSRPPFHRCRSRDAVRVSLDPAPSVVDARVTGFFGEDGILAWSPLDTYLTRITVAMRYVYRRRLLGALGFTTPHHEVIVEVSLDAPVHPLSMYSFEATLLRGDVRYDRFTQTTAVVEDRRWGWMGVLYAPVWIAHKILPGFVWNPYYHHRDGPAVVGDGSLRAVNMGEDECGVPQGGVDVNIVAVTPVAPPAVADEAKKLQEYRERVRYYVDSMDFYSVGKILAKAVVRKVWMGALEWVIGEQKAGAQKPAIDPSTAPNIKVNVTYRVHLAVPVSEIQVRPFGKGDILVLNVVPGSAVGSHESLMNVPCRPMILDVWDSLLNDETPRPVSIAPSVSAHQANLPDGLDLDDVSFLSQMFSIGWAFVLTKAFIGIVAIVLILHFQGILLTKDVDKRTAVISALCIVATMGVWGLNSWVVSLVHAVMFGAIKSEIGIE